ncbi:rhodanese-like domain-containing protein [Pararhodospirillum photometricum]|nr:rhodanese-like domain-containing protein [Pararhodospirillum photometricum]
MTVSVAGLRSWLAADEELALFDVREAGQIGEGHLLWSVPLPYSRLEARLPLVAPRRSVRVVLVDDGDGLAERAARRARALGYDAVSVLDGGVTAWQAAGEPLVKGVHVASKAFGELVERTLHTPSITAEALARRQARGEPLVILDGRPEDEYRQGTLPGSVCCPNGELALRLPALAPDPNTLVVIHCAGRTRSLLGTELLRTAGVKNPVVALENGTMGWQLAGFQVERDAKRFFPPDIEVPSGLRDRAAAFAQRQGVHRLDATTARHWLADSTRTTFVLDVRTTQEVRADPAPGAVHVPGGQLLQATDQWVGVRRSRLLLLDHDGERAPLIAGWLALAGWTCGVLAEGRAAWAALTPRLPAPDPLPVLRLVPPDDPLLRQAETLMLDLRPSAIHQAGHPPGARWAIRPRLAAALASHPRGAPVVLLTPCQDTARAAALDILEAGHVLPVLLETPGLHNNVAPPKTPRITSGSTPCFFCMTATRATSTRHGATLPGKPLCWII